MNDFKLMTRVLVSGAIALSTTLTLHSQPSRAQGTSFYCGQAGGVPATLASTPRGTVEVIRWVSHHFTGSGYDPQRRCQEVSARFQSHYAGGRLSYITAGYLNNLPAICVADGTSPCSSDRLLFTLKPGENAAQKIQQLFNVRSGASGPLYESTSGGSSAPLVDMNKFLQEAPVINAGATPSQTPATLPIAPSQPSTPTSGGGTVW